MQELIKIEKRVIGAEEVNSVNARELHKALEIKKDFSNWIKAQINRAGLRENVDYITISKKVKEGNNAISKEYIITTDASKHIAMMSQGRKAKEVRDYFIAVEKEYRASLHVNSNDALLQIMPVLQQMVQMMSVMMENQNKMMELLIETQKQNQLQKQNALTPDQLSNIKLHVLRAAKPLAEYHNFTMGRATREVYTEINGRMGVFTYYQISPEDYDEAIELLVGFKKQKEDAIADEKKREKLEVSVAAFNLYDIM